MEKRILLALALSSLVFVVYYGFIYHPPVAPPAATSQAATAPGEPGAATTAESRPRGVGAERSSTETQPMVPEVKMDMGTSLVHAVLSSRSGLPMAWALKKYFLQANNQGPNIDLLKDAAEQLPMGLLLFPGQPVVAPNFRISGQSENSLDYEGQLGSLGLKERVEFGPTDYSLQIHLVVDNRGSEVQTLSPGLHLEVEQSPPSHKGFLIFKEAPNFKFPVYRIGAKVKRHPNVDKLGAYQEEEGELSWTGIEDRYFLRILVSRNVSPKNRLVYGRSERTVFTELQYPPEALAPGQQREFLFTLYLGPKDPSLLGHFGEVQLDKAVDYGIFWWLAIPILWLLERFNSFLHNWGLAIIALTILIKAVLYPLTRTSMKSMKGMQALQPQLQKLREKHQDDREKLNLETMALFRQHKVNPMGGCLPMLIQMPIYIALYKVLYNATVLYHAPFYGPYHDLSAPDPYYILPILLGAFMVLQQKMTPSSVDPTQARMMMFMPIMFSLFMFFLPVGLVLYIFVNTVLTVLQQWMNQKDIHFRDLLRGGEKAG